MNAKSIAGSCTEACTVLSSGTASPYSRSSSSASLLVPNSSCTCQCNFDLPIFREDLHICVNDIHGNVLQNFFVTNYEVVCRGSGNALRRVTARTFSCRTLMISDCAFRYVLLPAGPNEAARASAPRTRIYMARSPVFSSSLWITAVFIAAINLKYAALRHLWLHAWLANGSSHELLSCLFYRCEKRSVKYYYLISMRNNNDIN